MTMLAGIAGQEAACLAVLLAAVEPGLGGVLLIGAGGTGKSAIARAMEGVLPEGTPFVTVPLHADGPALTGAIDWERSVAEGRRVLRPGLLERARGGVLLLDDLHLLSPETAGLLSRAAGVTLVATARSAEGDLSRHLLDRFGLVAPMALLHRPAERRAVLIAALAGPDPGAADRAGRLVAAARSRLLRLPVLAPLVEEAIAILAEEADAEGHRGELFLARAARALAAWEGAPAVTIGHVERMAPLVLEHRRRQERAGETPPEEQRDEAGDSGASQDTPGDGSPPPPDGAQDHSAGADAGPDDHPGDPSEGIEPPRDGGRPREEVMETGESFQVRPIRPPKDRVRRHCQGRRSPSAARGRTGHVIRTVDRGEPGDIALMATLRAAAPFQRARGREGRILIVKDDLRYCRREGHVSSLVLFLVDASGSMGAARRMVAVKGAVRSLLMDCYQKRDRVALAAFRRDDAELVLPPTRSVERAERRLDGLPVGGRTPLAAGFVEAGRVIRQEQRRDPRGRILLVLLSDGRANQALAGGQPLDESRNAARLLAGRPGLDILVIDTEDKRSFHRADLARQLAADLAADYVTLSDLAAPDLADLVRATRRRLSFH